MYTLPLIYALLTNTDIALLQCWFAFWLYAICYSHCATDFTCYIVLIAIQCIVNLR